MKFVVAILESYWNWKGLAGSRKIAPRFFYINSNNFSGRRLYKIVGKKNKLVVTESCKEICCGPNDHGTPDPKWLLENLKLLTKFRHPDYLLVCGKIAQKTFRESGFQTTAKILEIPHPAARGWTTQQEQEVARMINGSVRSNQG